MLCVSTAKSDITDLVNEEKTSTLDPNIIMPASAKMSMVTTKKMEKWRRLERAM